MRTPRNGSALLALLLGGALAAAATAQADPDRDGDGDGDGLTDFTEIHKYRTDPTRADSDGDGVPDGDWRERREYQYTVRSVVQVMRPVTTEYLCDDHQDARVLDATDEYVELEVIHYPFTDVAASIVADPDWRTTTAAMAQWTRPGPTNDWTPAMRDALLAALARDGIDAAQLDDRTLVERASAWLCRRARSNDCFTTLMTAFDAGGRPFLPDELAAAVPADAATLLRQWSRDLSARGMFEQRLRGSCSSSAIYLNGCLRALGVPTRTVLCIPVVDANDERERALLAGLTHHALRAQVTRAIGSLVGGWTSHSFNEVFVGGRWRRLDYDRLGRGIADPDRFGLMTHVATFADWADARMPDTIGRRQTLRRYDDRFGGPNPYSTLTLRDEFGVHCTLPNEVPPPPTARLTAVHWGDGPDVPDAVRAWFAERGAFGLVARVDGPTGLGELQQFLADADRTAALFADGTAPIEVALEPGAMWWHDDHALVFVRLAPDLRGTFTGAPRHHLRLNDAGPGSRWHDVGPLALPARAR